ncbi:MAG: hypothetical protein LUG50_09660 [Planctomycetaceae bacterium]|nr:hypothetical protein [Planctomycetaceae bacterium]
MDTPTGSVSEGMISGEDEATSIDGPADAEEALPENASDNEASGAGDFVWRMMKKDRLDLAYYWAKLAEDSGEPAVFPSSSAIRAIALANYLEENDEELHKEYEKHLSRSLSDFDVTSGEGGLGEARRLMALAASLIPLITRNSTNAEALVASSLNISGSPEVKRLIRIVKEFSECRFSIDLLRRGASNQAEKDRIENEFHNQAVSWLKEARSKKIIFDAGKKVWLVWLKSTGDIGRLVEGIIDNRRSEIDELRQIAQKWSQDKYIDKQIQDTDALLRKTGAKRRAITARSRVSLKKHVKEALKLFFKWELLSNFKVREKDFIKIPEYHVDLKKTLPLAKEWLAGKCEESIQNLALEVGYRLLRRTVDQLDTIIFHHENRAGFSSLPAGIDANLLRIPYIRLKNDAGCRPWLAVQPENFREALIAAGNDEDDWLTIAKMHMSSGNFGNAGLALELAENENLEEYDTIRASFKEKTVAARNNLYIRIKAARLKLNRAYCEGLLKEEEREQFDWPVKLAEVKDFHPINKSIAEMENLVAEKEREFTNQIREKINAMPDLSDDRRNRILQFLEKGRYLAAEGIVSGERYIEASYSTEEYDFYPDFIDRINSFTPTSKPPFDSKTFRKAAKQGKLGWQLPPENIEAALYNLDQFENLYRSGAKYKEKDASLKDRSVYLKTILTRIGFKNVDVQPFGKETDRRGAWYTMTCDTVNNRDVCPIPHFGSEADGKYSIYCVWDKPYGHELRDRVKKSTCPGRTIVIYLNWMDKDKRNDLAYQGGRSLPPDKAYIVLDCYLYLYICGQRNPLAALFNCAIMFSPGQPYQSTNNAGIPQEMFYGRTQQLDKICHRDGHLVYGGRQLGKTALLHAAQQRMHQPKEESYAFYLDLKNDSRTHIGTANQPSYIWTVMGKILFENGIISSGIARPDTFARCVMEWLDKNSKRRIFFFLDEADNFLEADRQSDWITVGELKNLMDKTTSRFKIVLAGLHNVQRTAKESNTPLAHFGDPICVGAFTDEVQAARDMINLPLRALGFRFEDPDLYLEILALTNYYPSLIQIFCRNLLDSLRRELSLKSSNVPPYTITHAHIQDAYNESIKHIRERFSWSLDLDPRYKFLAYMIAEELRLNPNGSNALTVGEIRTAALTIWDAGFGTQTGERDFSVLLDEMEGLGILRRVDNEMYTLRNRNVMALLGSPEGFEGGMLAAMDIEADTPYSPDIFRKKILKWSRNPLTESQELSLQDVVHGVIVIFGCSAAEVDKMPKALESSQSYEMRTLNWKNNATIHRFQEWVKDTTASQTKWTYLVVPAAVAWDMKWVKHAMNENRIGQSYRQRKVKIIFVGNSVQAWDWFINGNCVQGPNLRLMSLLPWHEQTLKQWFESLEIPFDRPKIRKTMGQCGGWGGLCDRFGEDVNRKNDRWDKHMNNDEEWTGADLFRDYFGLNFGTPEHEIFHLATEAFELFDDELDERGYYRTPVSYSEMKEWVSTMKPNLVDYLSKLWEWAAALSYIKRIDSEEDGDHWALNRILTRFAKAGAQ